MPEFGVKYSGLHKRDSYEGLIDYLENKQEKLKLPDREAKFVRDSPQYQTLLNEGFVEIEEQQLKQIKAEQAEHAVIRTANDTNETAKEVKVVASQTDKPLLVKTKSTGTQSAQASVRSTSSQSDIKHTAEKGMQSLSEMKKTTGTGSQTEIFDMTVNDNIKKVKQDIESVENTHAQNKLQQAQLISRKVQHHLGDQATPETTAGFAHKITAKVTTAGLKALGNIASRTIQQLSSASSSSQDPNTSLLLGDGKPFTDWSTMNYMPEPLLGIGDKPKLIPSSYKPTSSAQPSYKPIEIDDAVVKSKPKARPKPKSMIVEEQAAFDEVYDAIKLKLKPKPKPKPKAKTSTPPVIKKPKVTTLPVTTGTRIPPSKIGVHKLRELFEEAKNKNKSSVQDTSSYMKTYDDWKGAKGDKALKDEKIKTLREMYKRLLYNK